MQSTKANHCIVPFKAHEGDDPETNAFYNNIHSRVRSRIERLFAWQKSFRMLYSTDKNLKVIGAASKIVCALQHWALRCELPKYEPLLPVNPSRIHDLFRDAEECDCGFSTDSEDQEACRVVRKKAFESLVLRDFQLPPGKKPSKNARAKQRDELSDSSISERQSGVDSSVDSE